MCLEQAMSAAGTRCPHNLRLCQPMCAAARVPVGQRLTRASRHAKQKQLTASSVMQRLCLDEFRPPTAWHDFLGLGMSLIERFQRDPKQDPDTFPLPPTVCPPPCISSMVAEGSLQPSMCATIGLTLEPATPPGSACVAADCVVAGLVGGTLLAAPLACRAVACQPRRIRCL